MLPGPRTLRSDLLAALTVTALLAPESVANAQIAGIPSQFGLDAAPVTLLAYALLGRSIVLAVGAPAATVVLSGATVAQLSTTPAQRLELTFSDTQSAVDAFVARPTAPSRPTPTDLPAVEH